MTTKPRTIYAHPLTLLIVAILIGLALIPIMFYLSIMKNDCCIRVNAENNDWSWADGLDIGTYKLFPPQCMRPCESEENRRGIVTRREIELYNLMNKKPEDNTDKQTKSNFVIFEVGKKPTQWNQLMQTYFKTDKDSKEDESIKIDTDPDSNIIILENLNVGHPWKLEVVHLVRRKALVIGKFKWDAIKEKGVYHVTWEIDGGGITGHLFTESNEVNLSFWPNTIYHVKVETSVNKRIVQTKTILVNTAKAKFTSTDGLFEKDDYSVFVSKVNTYRIEVSIADVFFSLMSVVALGLVILCIFKTYGGNVPKTQNVKTLVVKRRINGVDEFEEIIRI